MFILELVFLSGHVYIKRVIALTTLVYINKHRTTMKPPSLTHLRLITFALAACMIYRNLRFRLQLWGLANVIFRSKDAAKRSTVIIRLIRPVGRCFCENFSEISKSRFTSRLPTCELIS